MIKIRRKSEKGKLVSYTEIGYRILIGNENSITSRNVEFISPHWKIICTSLPLVKEA